MNVAVFKLYYRGSRFLAVLAMREWRYFYLIRKPVQQKST